MSRQWMPMYWGDYLRDTQHLTLEQHGAYLLLICHYWNHGRLPSGVIAVSQVLRISVEKLEELWPAIRPFFDTKFRHKRIDRELKKNKSISEMRSAAGLRAAQLNKGLNNNGRFLRAQHTQLSSAQMSAYHKVSKKEGVAEGRKGNGVTSLAEIVRAKGWVR